MAVVSFSHTIQHSYVAVMGIVYPFALATFHVSYAVLGITLGVAGVCGGLMQGLAGIVKRVSARLLLGGQNLALALVSAIGALAPSFAIFGLVRVMGSLVTWPQHPVGSAHLTDRVPHRRGFVLAAHTTGGNFGTLLAPLAASGVIVAFGWRWALAGTGMVMALCSAVTWTRVRGGPSLSVTRPPSPRIESSGAESPVSRAVSTSADPAPSSAPPAAVPPERPMTLRNALRRRQALAVLVAGTISGAGRGAGVLTTYVPAYLRSGLHEPALLVGVLTAVVGLAAVEGYAAFRKAGYHPATLVGLVAVVGLMVGVYNRGEAAEPLVVVLLVAFTLLWHLLRVDKGADPVRSTLSTLFVYCWVGVFGSYAALLLSPTVFSHRHGIAYLLGAVITVVAYDVAALGVGSWVGHRPLTAISPNKTWEGLIGGTVVAIVVAVMVVHLIHPWTIGKAAALGVIVAVLAPIGDLAESLVKRHVGVKDMGRVLPGHGGLLDRVDGLLFVLPATYYLVRAFHLG